MSGFKSTFTLLNIKYYTNTALFYLTPPLLGVLLYFYGDEPAHFDRIYIGALVMSAYFCRKDIDTFSTVCILLLYWVASEILFAVPDTLVYWIVVYSVCLGISLIFFKHFVAKITLVLSLYAIGAEVNWWLSAYISKPRVFYFIGLMALTVGIQRLLYNRAMLMHDYFNYSTGKLALDGHVRRILFGYFALFAAMATEYYARHIGGLKEALLVYNYYSGISTLISAIILAVVYMHYFYNQSQKHLKN